MSHRLRRFAVRLGLVLRQNGLALLVVLAWLVLGTVWFRSRTPALSPGLSVLAALTLLHLPDVAAEIYRALTQAVVFGLVATLVVHNVTRRYRPEETSRWLAHRATGHVVVVGYSHFGRRVTEMLLAKSKPLVVVHPNRSDVETLIRDEQPLILGTGHDKPDLLAAAVDRAAVVILASDDVTVSAVALQTIRSLNKQCDIIVRCPDDDVGEVLSRAYGARVVSTSKLVAQHLTTMAERYGVRACLVIGNNTVGRRVREMMTSRQIACSVLAETHDPDALRAAGVGKVGMIVLAEDDLGKNLILVDRLRDLDSSVRIVCRVFHEQAAAVLTQRPFNCTVLSTSRFALDTLIAQGVFKKAGL